MTLETANMTDEQVRSLPVDQLAEALIAAAGPDDNARRGAAHLLVHFGDMSLIRLRAIRAYIVAAGPDGPLVQWGPLGRHLAEVDAANFNAAHLAGDDRRIGLLDVRSSSQLCALRLATALGSSDYRANLHHPAGVFGRANRVTVVEALAIAFGITPGTFAVPGNTHSDPGA